MTHGSLGVSLTVKNMRKLLNLILILGALAAVYFYFYDDKPSDLGTETVESVIERFDDSFTIEISEDADKISLKDVAGGTSSGVATRLLEDGRFSHYAIADLPEPEGGNFYEGWLVRGKPGDANFKFISTGKMINVKGGYTLNFESNTDYTEFGQVVITLETIMDSTPEKHILEGNF